MTARRLSKIAHSEPAAATAGPNTFFNAARPNSQQLRSAGES